MTLGIATLYIECHFAKCRDLFIVTVNVVRLNVVILSVFLVNAVMLSVFLVNVVMLNVVAPDEQTDKLPLSPTPTLYSQFSFSGPDKLECFSLAGLSILV